MDSDEEEEEEEELQGPRAIHSQPFDQPDFPHADFSALLVTSRRSQVRHQFAEGNDPSSSMVTPEQQETPRELSALLEDCSNCTKLKSHAIPCHDGAFCFNEGSCYVIPTLGMRFCQCQLGFRGTRCAEKQAPIGEQRLKEEVRSTEFFLIVIGSVAGMLLLIVLAIFITAFICKRSSRTSKGSEKEISLLTKTQTEAA